MPTYSYNVQTKIMGKASNNAPDRTLNENEKAKEYKYKAAKLEKSKWVIKSSYMVKQFVEVQKNYILWIGPHEMKKNSDVNYTIKLKRKTTRVHVNRLKLFVENGKKEKKEK